METGEMYAIKEQLIAWTTANSGHDASRNYLGMSRIGECPLSQYRHYQNGAVPPSADRLMKFYLGNLFERDMKARLAGIGLYQPGSEQELVAAFDPRFRGHTDGRAGEQRLLEIKSTHSEALADIRETRHLPKHHFAQVQCYLHHSGLREAVVVYVARDTGELWVHGIVYQADVAARLNERAQTILAALDAGRPPACICRRCC